jgi:hypothetical protein
MKTLNELAGPGKVKIPQEKLVNLISELNHAASAQLSFE